MSIQAATGYSIVQNVDGYALMCYWFGGTSPLGYRLSHWREIDRESFNERTAEETYAVICNRCAAIISQNGRAS